MPTNFRSYSTRLLGVGFVVAASFLGFATAQDKGAAPGLYFDAKTVADGFAKAGGTSFFDQDLGPLHLLVRAGHRMGTGMSEQHAKKTDVLYIVKGTATFVTGGKLVGAKDTAPDEQLGSGVEGGEAHTVKPGDVIVIPPRTPHWFKEIPTDIQYFTVQFR